MIHANQDTLRELHIIGLYVNLVPVRIFDLLTHLEIHMPYGCDISGLEFVFRHAIGLESLVLNAPWSLISLPLDTNTKTLPSLSSLRLSTLKPRSSRSICGLIRGRVSLQRLYLCPGDCWSEIFPIIKDLPALRVLGLETSGEDVDLEFIALHLPPTIESLQLILSWDDEVSFAPLVLDLHASQQITHLLASFISMEY
jgi:hypothetical protein